MGRREERGSSHACSGARASTGYWSDAVRVTKVTVDRNTTALPLKWSVAMPNCGSGENAILMDMSGFSIIGRNWRKSGASNDVTVM